MELMARVRDEEVDLSVTAVVGRGDAHARVRVVDPETLRDVLEAEAELRAIGPAMFR